MDGEALRSTATFSPDTGRLSVNLSAKKKLPELSWDYANDVLEDAVERPSVDEQGKARWGIVKMNILILIVGSRGDVQPYLALALKLVEEGHRVRLGTHGEFKSLIEQSSKFKVEFFDIGGDPKDLMSYMVKNPGLLPGWDSLTNGDIGRKTKMLSEIMNGAYRACLFPDPRTGSGFAVDAIISNPPVFGHIHIAECLGIPLQMSFTMPWTPTIEFSHPLVDLRSNTEPSLSNYLSYGLADHLTWRGLAGVINKFRKKTLGLIPLSGRSGPSVVDRLKIPWTYCWSQGLIPKPHDWKNTIDISGFYFLDLATDYRPPPDLEAFLAAGPPPIYIGFGSVPVKDPAAMTTILLEAVRETGVRALISAGWGGLGGSDVPENVFILGSTPHDWLFTKVSAVCHHGGAGTTAIGLLNGRPTIVVEFQRIVPLIRLGLKRASR
ncbi:hypothetical protein FRB94_007337 [Tulasnella sp. JGI-2019a]|nr:hypothetical protein FRB94_007337 [Tulasnella sp. JGI-2019a]